MGPDYYFPRITLATTEENPHTAGTPRMPPLEVTKCINQQMSASYFLRRVVGTGLYFLVGNHPAETQGNDGLSCFFLTSH
jgi:hypothetical protein